MCPSLKIIHTRIQAHVGTRQRKTLLKRKQPNIRNAYPLIKIAWKGFAKETTSLQDSALLLLVVSLCQEGSASGGLEDLTDALVGSGGALQVLVGTDLLTNLLTLMTVVSACSLV